MREPAFDTEMPVVYGGLRDTSNAGDLTMGGFDLDTAAHSAVAADTLSQPGIAGFLIHVHAIPVK